MALEFDSCLAEERILLRKERLCWERRVKPVTPGEEGSRERTAKV